jgi:hypothetical protein
MIWVSRSLVDIFKVMYGLATLPQSVAVIIALLFFSPVFFIYHDTNGYRLFHSAYASRSNSLSSNTRTSSISTTQGINDLTTTLSDSIKKFTNKLITEANGNGISYSGKIASSQINPDNGKVEKVLFGSWSLDSKPNQASKFFAKFTMTRQQQGQSSTPSSSPSSSESPSHGQNENPITFVINNLKANSIQRANEDLTLGGTVEINEQQEKDAGSAESWNNIPVTISINNHATNLIITFERDSPAAMGEVFSDLPITGVVTSKSENNDDGS